MVTRRRPSPPARAARSAPAASSHAALDRHVGALIREARSRERLTVTDVAQRAGLSVGMLSKIENGQVSPSLDSLNRIARALGLPIGQLFRNFGAPAGSALLVKKGQGMEVVRRGTAKGHTYHLLAYDQGPVKRFEPFLISMDDESEVFPTFEHPGTEFIYMLEGRLEYRHGDQTYKLAPGDALTFRGDVPHGPERLIKLPIRFLTIITYGDGAPG
jgi:transcriptional regulator with XRE-family HTH domain